MTKYTEQIKELCEAHGLDYNTDSNRSLSFLILYNYNKTMNKEKIINTPLKYYFHGAISGMVGIALSQPIDAIKTHYQLETNGQKKFSMSYRNLYKGISTPLIGVGLEKAIVFGTYNYFKKELNCNSALSGGVAGFAAAFIVTPCERIKILYQSQLESELKFTFKNLFKGLNATYTREIPGFAIYFFTYDYLKERYNGNDNFSLAKSFCFGGLSGSLAWVFIYPQDRIKTLVQSQRDAKFKDIIATIYNSGGLKQFYKGFSFAIMRAILLHSGTFSMMEFLSRY